MPEKNICIEYDGEQHFKPCTFGDISLEVAITKLQSCKERDAIKTQYCKDNNIRLLRIPYFKFNKIKEILSSILI